VVPFDLLRTATVRPSVPVATPRLRSEARFARR
jgi:hypothetical protein